MQMNRKDPVPSQAKEPSGAGDPAPLVDYKSLRGGLTMQDRRFGAWSQTNQAALAGQDCRNVAARASGQCSRDLEDQIAQQRMCKP